MASGALLTADDLHLFHEGSHGRLYRKLGAHAASETVGRGHPAAQADAAPGPSRDTGRDCDIAVSVLNYRKILATVFPTDSASTDVDAQAKELAGKGCRSP